MSKEGLAEVDNIVAAVFEYIAMLRSADPPEWIFDECRRLYNTYFRFLDKSTPDAACTSLAKSLRVYPPSKVS